MNNSRPVSPAVPKTNAANKRLRKAIDDAEEQFYMQPAAKKAKNNHSAEPETTPMVNGGVAEKGGVNCDNNGANHKKKLTRKKQLEQEREHLLEQKLLTARR